MALSDTLAGIPGYAGYQAARLRNQQEEQAQLQQALGLANVVGQVQKIEQQKALTGATPEQYKDPEFWSRLAIAHNKPEYETHAERLRADRGKATELATMRGKKNPETGAFEGGIFDSLAASDNPQIAQQGKALKASLERSDTSIDPKYWQTQQAQLAARETALLNRPERAAEPLHPIIGPDGKPKLVPRSQAVGATPYSPSIAGAGTLEPDSLKLAAEQYLAGDRNAIQGFARNATARIALQNEIQRQAKAKGWSGADVAAQMADFAGTMAGSRSTGQRAAQISLAATESEKMIPVAEAASKAFDRTNYPKANLALKAWQENSGRPEVKAYGAALNSLVNVYARAIAPNGTPTVSDKDHAREMISTIDSPEQFAAVMGILKQELSIAKAAPGEVRDATRNRVSPQPATETPAPTPAPAAGGYDAAKERRYQEWKARQPK